MAMQHKIVVILLNSVVKQAEPDGAGPNSQTDPVPSLGRSFADLLDSSLLLLRTGMVSEGVIAQGLKVLKQPVGFGRQSIAKFLYREVYKMEPST